MKPRVFCAIPTRGTGRVEAIQSHYALPTRGAVEIIPGMATGSLLAHNHNVLWAAALKWHAAGIIDYLCIHHDDVEIRTHGWLDLMVKEMKRVQAAILSAVVPIKSDHGDGETSTALDWDDPWNPRKLKLRVCWDLPATFSAKDTAHPHRPLLVNTGLMLLDLSRPEFLYKDAAGELVFKFEIRDRIVPKPDGEFSVEVFSEDWFFSRVCAAHGLPVFATTAVQLVHHGSYPFPNYKPDEDGAS